MSLKTCQTHGLSHFPLIEHQSCCVLSCMWRREGDGAGRNGCNLTGNTSRPIPAPGLSGPIAGPQLAAACPLQRPRVQPVPITATESWLARDESPSLGEDSSPPEKDFVKSPNTSINALSISLHTLWHHILQKATIPVQCLLSDWELLGQVEPWRIGPTPTLTYSNPSRAST